MQGSLPLALATPSSYSPTARLPQKLVSKIQNFEFVEMSELLPEAWIPEPQDTPTASRRPPRYAPVTDILVWTECFSLMAAVLAEKHPGKAPQLFAYLRRIVHAARNFRGTAWVAYDRLYRRQALAHRSLDWAQEDSCLYNEAFVGQAKSVPRCRHCLSDTHTTEGCPELGQFHPMWVHPYPGGPAPVAPPFIHQPPNVVPELCRKFNENRCFSKRCRYQHACLNCGHPHPAAFCRMGPSHQGEWFPGRSRSPRHRTQGPRGRGPEQ